MTSAIPSFVPPVAPQAPMQAPMQASAPASAQNPGFAQMLTRTQQAQEQSAPADEPTPERAPAARVAERGQQPEKPRAEKPAKAETEAARSGERAEQNEAKVGGDEATKAEEAHADPALAEWLAGLHLPPAGPQAPEVRQAAGDAAGGAGDRSAIAKLKTGLAAQAGADGTSALGNRPDATAPDALAARTKPEPSALDAALSATKESAPEVGAEQVRELKPATDFQQQLSALAHTGHATPTGAARAGETAAPVTVQMPVPATSPAFAHSLGVQVSVLARDGVQQAELHLNPAEMGPISIQIAIEGNQAQVNFGADSAVTRQIIESGLPELAASLREAGLTLCGGGVHSQARGRGDEGAGPGRDGQGGTTGARSETDVTVQRSVARAAAGGVDVYA